MAIEAQPSYVPALRMKAGELAGLRDLAPDVANRVLPRMIVPPREERDRTFMAQLFKTEEFPNIADALTEHWWNRSVLVEATHLLPDFGHESMGLWLPKMFERARRAGTPAVPLVALSDLTADNRAAYKAACGSGSVRFGVAVPSGDLVDRDAIGPLLRHLEAMGLSPADCSIIADFSDADFVEPDIVAPIIGGALETLQELGVWTQVVFQGTNYPDTNPAEAGGSYRILRNEWKAWRKAVGFDPATAERMIFGDYAADCATMAFGGGGGRAIRHYRYSTPDVWIVERGGNGTDAATMRDVCLRIVNSGDFAGRSFSKADEYIFLTAQGEAGPGNAAIWRAVNTTHHITRVVADIGGVRGFALKQRANLSPVQESLFTTS